MFRVGSAELHEKLGFKFFFWQRHATGERLNRGVEFGENNFTRNQLPTDRVWVVADNEPGDFRVG